MKLHGYWRSSCTYRVRIALALKKLDYEVVPVNLLEGRQANAEHVAINPSGQVPVLVLEGVDGERALGQSVAIMEYLEELVAEPALLPKDPVDRARVRQLVEVVNSGIQPLQNLAVMKQLKAHGVDPQAWCKEHILRGLTAYQILAQAHAGRFSFGDTPTLADCALVPQLYNARRFEIDVASELPLLHRIDDACASHDAFRAAHPDRQPDAA